MSSLRQSAAEIAAHSAGSIDANFHEGSPLSYWIGADFNNKHVNAYLNFGNSYTRYYRGETCQPPANGRNAEYI
jgi:hypothetical protein